MGVTVSITNQKGGVGKTTITFNTAIGLAEQGYKILAIDNDPQGNLTSAFLEQPENLSADIFSIYSDETVIPIQIQENLFFIGATISLSRISESDFDLVFKLKEYLEGIKQNYDYILIDCLPSFGYLNLSALNASDYVVIPVKPAPFALRGLKDLFDTIKKTQKRLNPTLKVAGIVLNLLEKTVLHGDIQKVLQEEYGDYIFNISLSKGVKFEESPAFNESIFKYAPQSKQTQQFNQFLREFLVRIAL